MNKLPKFPHMRKREFMENVYEPSEDTFILMEAIDMLLKDPSFRPPAVCIEIGVGAGVVITYAAQMFSAPVPVTESSADSSIASPARLTLQPACTLFIGTELNPVALRAARETAALNDVGDRVELLLCDLCAPLLPRLAHSVDLLLANPPYVPDDMLTSPNTWIDRACIGGIDGNGIIRRILVDAKQLLREETGRLLLVCIERNDPAGLIQWAKTVPLDGRVLLDWTAGIEHLHVLEFRIPSEKQPQL